MTHEVKMCGAFLQVGDKAFHIDKIGSVVVGIATPGTEYDRFKGMSFVKIYYNVGHGDYSAMFWYGGTKTEDWALIERNRNDANKLFERILSALELAV